MKRLLILFVFGISFIPFVKGQKSVRDYGAIEALIDLHKTQYKGLKSMKEEEAQLLVINNQIKSTLDEVKKIEETGFKALKSVELIVTNAKDLIYIYDVTEDIVKYQNDMLKYAVDDPRLAVIAAKTELALIKRTKKLMEYIVVAVTGTDINLMNNKQRTDLIKYVSRELRNMRGLAYSVCRQIKSAKRYGVAQAIKKIKWDEFTYPKPKQDERVKKILENYKPGRGKTK